MHSLQLAVRANLRNLMSERSEIHGIDHWDRVAQNGLAMARVIGANEQVVALFAYLHDTCREHDGRDPEHGLRAAELADKFRNVRFRLSDEDFETLKTALRDHDKGFTTDDVTIGTCWDADRLDLPRVGVTPNPLYMSTVIGRVMAITMQEKEREHA